MTIEDMIPLVTNVGFPVAICFILLHYVLETIGERLDKLDQSLSELAKAIKEADLQNKSVR